MRYGNYVGQVTFIVKSDLIPFWCSGTSWWIRSREYQNGIILAEEIKRFYGRAGTGIRQLGFKGRLRTYQACNMS